MSELDFRGLIRSGNVRVRAVIFSAMKSKYLFVLAILLLAGAIAVLAHGFHGTFSFTGAAPVGSSALEISGASHGVWALAGVGTLLLSILTFVGAVVRAFIFETGK